MTTPQNATKDLADRICAHLCKIASQTTPITYQALAAALDLQPPNTIHRVTVALECTIEQDAAEARPLIAALVISKARMGLPAPGFFDCAQRFELFDGDPRGTQAATFHTSECAKASQYWRTDTSG